MKYSPQSGIFNLDRALVGVVRELCFHKGAQVPSGEWVGLRWHPTLGYHNLQVFGGAAKRNNTGRSLIKT